MSDDQDADPAPETAAAPESSGATSMTVDSEADTLAEDAADGDARTTPWWQETLLLVAVAIVLAVVIKAFFAQAFYIPSGSMEPGLVKNDRILVQKPSYWGDGTPQRGDVVVFEDPGDWLPEGEGTGPGNVVSKTLARVGLFPEGGHLVKRVIGVAGDTIVCCNADKQLVVNGEPLDESDYIKDDENAPCAGPMTGTCRWSAGPVPEGTVFVMGDNRNDSGDSSAHLCTEAVTDCTENPYVDVDSVTGKVATLVWPISRWEFLDRPGVLDDVPDPE